MYSSLLVKLIPTLSDLNYFIFRNKDDISSDVLSGVTLFVIPGPREKFTESEFNSLKKYLDSGGNILILVGEGGEKNFQTNVNFLLEEYGIMINTGKYDLCNIHTEHFLSEVTLPTLSHKFKNSCPQYLFCTKKLVQYKTLLNKFSTQDHILILSVTIVRIRSNSLAERLRVVMKVAYVFETELRIFA